MRGWLTLKPFHKGEIIMGLDNGVIVRSTHRKLTRAMLPEELIYPFDKDYEDDGIEILYWRKNRGLRNAVVNTFPIEDESDCYYLIETSQQVFELIRIIVSFMNKETWEEDGNSIWDYDEILPILQRDIINLAIIASFMKNNPDVY